MHMTTIRERLASARSQFIQSSSAQQDAEILLMHALQCTRSFLYARLDDNLTDLQATQFNHLVTARAAGIPVAYLVGQREFWSLPLRVTAATLIPRPETELLVEITLALFANCAHVSLLDLGCGSGAIALALAHTHTDWSLVASDLSAEALAVANGNADSLQLNNVNFYQSDWFTQLPPQRFDGIVANPPYLASNDTHLQTGDLRFEPQQALVSGPQGLDALTHIIHQAPHFLKSNGYLVLEHGYNQAEAVAALLQTRGFHSIYNTADLQGHPRVTQAIFA